MKKPKWSKTDEGLKYEGYSYLKLYVRYSYEKFFIETSDYIGREVPESRRSLKAAIKRAEKIDLVQRKKEVKRSEAELEMSKFVEEQNK